MSQAPGTDQQSKADWIESVMRQHEAVLLRYALSLTGEPERARDAVQDTFLRLCQQERTALEGHLAPWLFTVCRNRILDGLRKDQRMTQLEDDQAETQECAAPNPAATAERDDSSRAVLSLMNELPLNQREVVRLKFHAQLSYQEISDVTSLSVTNVGFLLHTALKTLRRRWKELETSPTPRPTSSAA
ncbi:MAG TPA: sigma-70 family RNA polymerase sigma factor [Candidatus Limnocylindria bacterium]|jgi:RNA polymerase sigma-70 factor (ECF subfamily)|nr:sigma-70 family RNA polymerase sigma factor [Candidatus Limnocylindria bacterium]